LVGRVLLFNRKKRVAVDVDGTLANVIPMWLKVYNEEYNKNLDYKSIDKWVFWNDLGISARDFFRIFSKAWSRWEEIEPMEESIAENTKILHHLCSLDIVTGRTKDTLKFVKKWLEKHQISYNRFIAVPSWQPKIYLPYDVYIDDSPDLARLAACEKKLVLLYNQPWNTEIKEGVWVKRINNLREAIEILKGRC
jgi:uncharacterized HAD superfamily protein